MKALKGYLIGTIILLVIIGGFYRDCIATTNEIGFLGFDKVGRQIFIQSLDHFSQPKLKVDSDFFDRPIFLRLLQEPMRTTLRLDILTDENGPPTKEQVVAGLAGSYEEMVGLYTEPIPLNKRDKIPIAEFRQSLDKAGAKTLEDFLAGLGFDKYEVFYKHKLVASIKLKKLRPNVKWAGAE